MSRVFQNFKDAAMFAKEQSVKSKKLHLVKRIEDNWVVLSKNEKKTMIEWGLFSCLGCSNKNQDIVLFKALDDHYNWSLICNNCGSRSYRIMDEKGREILTYYPDQEEDWEDFSEEAQWHKVEDILSRGGIVFFPPNDEEY